VKPLLFIPSPRDIPEVKESIDKLKIDKIWIKYHKQEEAYVHARVFFLHHDFTHLIIHPDDMIATPQNLDQLIRDIESDPDKVISGYCNVTAGTTDYEDANISYTLPPNPPISGQYNEYHFIKLKDIQDTTTWLKVKYTGFALLALPRSVVQKIPFRTDNACCPDSCFSLDLDSAGIPQYVDPRIYCKHIRTNPSILLTDKKQKQIIICTDLAKRDIREDELRHRIKVRIAFLESTMNDTPDDNIGPLKWLVEQLQDILKDDY
jgi:hypothetical protein